MPIMVVVSCCEDIEDAVYIETQEQLFGAKAEQSQSHLLSPGAEPAAGKNWGIGVLDSPNPDWLCGLDPARLEALSDLSYLV